MGKFCNNIFIYVNMVLVMNFLNLYEFVIGMFYKADS